MNNNPVFDVVLSLVLIMIFYIYSKSKYSRKEESFYKYYSVGLLLKLLGAFFFCCIYAFYYGGGDTLNYYAGVRALNNIFWKSPNDFLKIIFLDNDSINWSLLFEYGQSMPKYIFKDDRTFLVVRLTSFLSLFVFGGFFSTTILLSRLSYIWIWKFYQFIVTRYKNADKMAFFAVLGLPSVVFWGSGIMKDTFTFSATCFFLVGLNNILIERRKILINLLQLVFSFYLILSVKSYILFALLPGAVLFFNFERVKRINSKFIKIVVFPTVIVVSFIVLQILFIDFNEMFGKYSADRLLEEAIIQQEDLKRDVYGENSFDLGTIEPTMIGALKKAPLAINAALFRPYLWESGNPVMVLSALENAFLLLFSVYLLIKIKLNLFRKILRDGFLLFSLTFILLLAFGVGFSTSNFGALVRYKIPFMPFYFFMLTVIADKKMVLRDSLHTPPK